MAAVTFAWIRPALGSAREMNLVLPVAFLNLITSTGATYITFFHIICPYVLGLDLK